ncbi:hypothetical protein T10_6373 [Trichinella papuae]|uniref:Uncharacterized protein n=1 Tax=Trichinella papuae TaxID=268474 RepID=A0A0V1MV29_9BILA|nr:hypothetical protein T10_6373 [Trichinella papuae]
MVETVRFLTFVAVNFVLKQWLPRLDRASKNSRPCSGTTTAALCFRNTDTHPEKCLQKIMTRWNTDTHPEKCLQKIMTRWWRQFEPDFRGWTVNCSGYPGLTGLARILDPVVGRLPLLCVLGTQIRTRRSASRNS